MALFEPRQLTFGSLFAGIGGFDLGFERVGMKCLWQVEIDEKCQKILRRHWPHTPCFSDVREWPCNRDEYSCDVVCGGSPCQDLSVAGKRKGLQGERSSLFWEYVRIVKTLAPKIFVFENVPGLLSSNKGADMSAVLGSLAELGYDVAYRVLDAQYFGLAQRRKRLFIAGHLVAGRAREILFEQSCSTGHIEKVREAGSEVARAVTASIGGCSGKEQQHTFVPELAYSLNAGDAKGPLPDRSIGTILASQTVDTYGVREVAGVSRWLDIPPDGCRYKQLGNAVAVNVAEWIGRRIVELSTARQVA